MMGDKIRVIEQHEYMSVVMGRHRITLSFSGVKASSMVPNDLLNLLFAAQARDEVALKALGLQPGTSWGDVVRAFAAKVPELWPEWNKAPFIPAVGSRVEADFGRRKGLDVGTVLELKRNYALVDWVKNGRAQVQFDMLKPA
jgi:hypothetical protein